MNFHDLFPGSGQGKQYPWLLQQLQARTPKPQSILDYGCGKGGTLRWLAQHGYTATGYDPYWQPYANPEVLAEQYDVLYSADVLEHIELEHLPWHVFKQASKSQLHIIDLTPAKKHLPTGENAHVTLLSPEEWCELFEYYLDPQHMHTHTYSEPDKNFKWRTRLCLHIEL